MAQAALQSTAQDKQTVTGLTTAEVHEREQRGQTNAYQARVGRSYWHIFRDNVLNLFNFVLGTLLLIVLLFQDYATVFFAGFSVVTNTFLGMIQEMNAKRKLDNLATLTEQQVTVWRDGEKQQIAMRAVVKDDLIEIAPGDKLVVDGLVVTSDSLEIDESQLTGESDAVFKEAGAEIYSGSFVVAGTGIMRATRVGKESNINKLSAIAKQYKRQKTPTQRRIDIVVEFSVVVMAIFVPLLFINDLLATVPAIPFLSAVRNAVVFVTSLVPQGLVLVAILSLTIGAIRISQHDTLIQKVNAVESLANATVLCFDKTGTLTKNELAVTEIRPLNQHSEDDILPDLARYLHNLAHRNRTATAIKQHVDARYTPNGRIYKEREIPFTSGRKWGAVVFDDTTLILGAPERILAQDDARSLHQEALQLSRNGYRVVAFAQMAEPPQNNQIAGACEPIALIVMSDQIREDIGATLQAFHDENIALKVISGDNLETVRAIATQSGMAVQQVYSGEELDAASDEQLSAMVQQANVFARIEPETKRRIVKALQANNHYVAMVGDGVNDVPALKQSNLAIVMNAGTQISKDVADIVLLNDAMSTLPLAFREGTEITQTIYGTMKLFLARNFYMVLFFMYVLFMSLPFPITPIQISWATFGSLNIAATLIAFGIVRPQFMKNFRADVLDYIITGGFIASVMVTLLYILVYFGTERDLGITRAAITIFYTLFNAYIVMSIQGVDFYQPRTFLKHWRVVAVMTLLAVLTVWAMYLSPTLFEFHPLGFGPHTWIFVLIYVLLMLAMVLLSHGLKYRYLIKRMWALFAGDDEKIRTLED